MAKEFWGGTWSGRGRARRGRRRGARSRRRPRRPWIGRQAGIALECMWRKTFSCPAGVAKSIVVYLIVRLAIINVITAIIIIITVVTPAWIFIYRRRGLGCSGRVVEHLVIGWWTPLSGSAGPATSLHVFSITVSIFSYRHSAHFLLSLDFTQPD